VTRSRSHLPLVNELDRRRITFEPVAVHEDLDAGLRLAVPANATGVEANAPFGEELTQRVQPRLRGLGVEDPRVVVGVQRRDARVVALLDAAVGVAGV
jgi:hypothetical protein